MIFALLPSRSLIPWGNRFPIWTTTACNYVGCLCLAYDRWWMDSHPRWVLNPFGVVIPLLITAIFELLKQTFKQDFYGFPALLRLLASFRKVFRVKYPPTFPPFRVCPFRGFRFRLAWEKNADDSVTLIKDGRRKKYLKLFSLMTCLPPQDVTWR